MDPVTELNATLADRYRVEREIGRGGMATVYLARDVRHDRLVALKVLNPELGAVLGVERFLAEIKVTANLQHPNLLPLFDSGEAKVDGQSGPGLLFYVMPFVDGESLRARLAREKQLPVGEAIRLAVAIAGALDYAHRHGVIHRDLKPENILLHEGQPLIADFGIALAVSNAGGGRITATGLSLGTPQYMSPEQATGDRVIDGRSDIYSLAAVTYEMLAGEPPHYATTSQAIIARLLTEQPRSVRVSRPSVPEHVELALMQALAKLPADRWSTAGEFADALQGRGVPPTRATLPTAGGAATTTSRPWRQRLSDPVTIALAVIALLGVAAAMRERMRPSVDPPVIRFPLTLPADVHVGSSTVGSPLAISPDGQTIVFTAKGADGTDQLWRRALEDDVAHPILGTRNAQGAFFSPDGQWIAFWSAGKLQKVASAGTSTPMTLAETPIIFGGAWSKSGVIVIAAGPLFTVPSTGGELRRLTPTSNTRVAVFPYALDDGEHAIFAERGNGGLETARLTILDLRSGETRPLGLAGTHPLGVIDGFLVYGSAANGVLAAPFDVRRLRETGGATPVVSDIIVGANGGTKAALSPAGTLVYQSGTREAEIVAVDMKGNARPLLSTKASFGYPRLSPDGKSLAVTEANGPRLDIWTFDLASGTPSRLTSDGGINERPEWTPDGKRVLFRSDRGTHTALWWQPADRSAAAKPLLASARESYFEGVMTPDGRGVVYQMDTLNEDIFYRALSGDTTPKPIAASGFNEDRPRVSPDGKWVAFVTEESGNSEVVVQPLPGPGARVQVSAGGGVEPVWARDGKRIFYRAGTRMMAATVATAPTLATLTVTSRTPLFEGNYLMAWSPHANYDVTPDGRELIMVRPVGGEQVVVVHNWRQELKKRMGR